ncbi:hypothetical protein D020_3652B, partial [Vibrio parahaemolyticus SBR10290]
LTNLLATV